MLKSTTTTSSVVHFLILHAVAFRSKIILNNSLGTGKNVGYVTIVAMFWVRNANEIHLLEKKKNVKARNEEFQDTV